MPPNYYLKQTVILTCASLISLGILIVVFKRFQKKAFLNKNMASALSLLPMHRHSSTSTEMYLSQDCAHYEEVN